MSYNANDAVSDRLGMQNWGRFLFFAFLFCFALSRCIRPLGTMGSLRYSYSKHLYT